MKEKLLKLSAYIRMKMYEWIGTAFVLDSLKTRLLFHKREIWHCHLGINIGDEERGEGEEFLRPILIVKKFNDHLFWGIPLTRTMKDSPYYFKFKFLGKTESALILSQLRILDSQRLYKFIGMMSTPDFNKVKEKLTTFLL